MSVIAQNYNRLSASARRELRDRYVVDQRHKCYHCRESLLKDPPEWIQSKKVNWDLFPPNFLKYPIHLHHNHNTGMTIGAVHSLCNAVLWQFHGE